MIAELAPLLTLLLRGVCLSLVEVEYNGVEWPCATARPSWREPLQALRTPRCCETYTPQTPRHLAGVSACACAHLRVRRVTVQVIFTTASESDLSLPGAAYEEARQHVVLSSSYLVCGGWVPLCLLISPRSSSSCDSEFLLRLDVWSSDLQDCVLLLSC